MEVIIIENLAIISFLLMSMQVFDSYLRYLPFRDKMNRLEIRRFWIWIFICGLISFWIYFTIFLNAGLIVMIYKAFFPIGKIPFFIVSIILIKRSMLEHFFVLGMSILWTLTMHSLTAFIDVIFFSQEIIFLHIIIFLILLLILLPIERKFFTTLLPSENFFESYKFGKYIVMFPFISASGFWLMWIDNIIVHSWQERFFRMYLPLIFFILYRYVLIANRQMYESQQTKRLQEQLSMLEEYNRLMQESQKQMAILRHDMRHNYRLIYTMLKAGDIDEALKHIETQENSIESATVKIFCNVPLVNAALSIYLQRAENSKIKFEHRIDLPKNLKIDESDFAILISNLLENATIASLKQPIDRRRISIIIAHIENQCALEVTNLFDFKVNFENGLPITNRDGHGIGIISLKNFVEKYNAQLDFSHENCQVKVMIYFENV